MSSSDTAAGVRTPRSVKSNVINLAGVKSTVGKSMIRSEGVTLAVSWMEEAFVVVAVEHFRVWEVWVMSNVSFWDKGYMRANL